MDSKIADDGLLRPLHDEGGPRIFVLRGGAVQCSYPPGAQEFLPSGHWISIMLEPSPGVEVVFGRDVPRIVNGTAVMPAINPAGTRRRANLSARMEQIIVSIAPENLREIAGDEFDRARAELTTTHLTLDSTALRFAKMIKAELTRPGGCNALHLHSLITLLAIRVLRDCSNAAGRVEVKGALSTTAEERIRDYLEEHFRRKLSIAELAGICGLSPGYFTQAFFRTFGSPPHRYIIERRLEFAEKLLAETEMPVAEVAYLSGFSSQSHLTNMLRVHKKKTPGQYR